MLIRYYLGLVHNKSILKRIIWTGFPHIRGSADLAYKLQDPDYVVDSLSLLAGINYGQVTKI